MEQLYKVYYEIKDDLGLLKFMPFMKTKMEKELMRVYNIYASEANGGITDLLNETFNQLHPNYFEDNKDKDWTELIEYNQFIADMYMKAIVNELNRKKISRILDFYVDPKELVFTGRLKRFPKITISFYMKPVE